MWVFLEIYTYFYVGSLSLLQGIFPTQGLDPVSSPALQADSFTSWATREAQEYWSGCHVLLQGIFPTQGWNPGLLYLLHWQTSSLPLVPPGTALSWLFFLARHDFFMPLLKSVSFLSLRKEWSFTIFSILWNETLLFPSFWKTCARPPPSTMFPWDSAHSLLRV